MEPVRCSWRRQWRQSGCGYEKSVDAATKNDHFRSMLAIAKSRGFSPQCVVFDGWYSSLANLKLIRVYGWIWLTRLKRNWHINPDRSGNRPLHEVDIAATGTIVHLKGYGLVKVFKIVAPDGDIDYWATNDLEMGERQRLQFAEFGWAIEEYHRGLQQCCGVERAQVRSSRAQRNHMGLAIRAFCAWNCIGSLQGSVGMRQSRRSCVMQFELIWRLLVSFFQLCKSCHDVFLYHAGFSSAVRR